MTSLRSGAQAAEADQILHVLRRIQILAGREWRRVNAGNLGEQRKIERIARLLEPAQAERRERLGVAQAPRRDRICELASTASRAPEPTTSSTASSAAKVLVERHAADLHLHHRVAGVEMAAHLVLQVLDGLARRSTSRRRRNRTPCRAILPPLKRSASSDVQRLVRDLGDGVPDRNLDRADARPSAREWPPAFSRCIMHGENFFRRRDCRRCVEQRCRARRRGCAE